MLFNSYPFAFLVATTFFAYYLPPLRRIQVPILILASCVFYGYTQPYLLVLLLVSANTNAVASYFVLHGENPTHRKLVATAGVVFNLSVLSTFKYSGLIAGWFGVAPGEGDGAIETLIALPLPIGISFYTFQGISLLVDVYRGDVSDDARTDDGLGSHWLRTILYIVYFPQLVAGPIVKARDFYPQIMPKALGAVDLYACCKALVLGFFLKSVVADNLKDQTFWIADPYFTYQSSLTLATMMVAYSGQIFADFAGYSLIAIGIAGLFGYRLPVNFDFPYISRSVTEFWRRWHISLSSWLRDYLYIGLLGGNRVGKVRTYINLLTVMFLGGLWHGAAISYGVWGLWHGLGLVVERLLGGRRREPAASRSTAVAGATAALRIIGTFCFVTVGWLLFKLTDFGDVLNFLDALATNGGRPDNDAVLLNSALFVMPVFVYHAVYLARAKSPRFETIFVRTEPLLYAVLLFLVLTNGGIPGEFVYFQF